MNNPMTDILNTITDYDALIAKARRLNPMLFGWNEGPIKGDVALLSYVAEECDVLHKASCEFPAAALAMPDEAAAIQYCQDYRREKYRKKLEAAARNAEIEKATYERLKAKFERPEPDPEAIKRYQEQFPWIPKQAK